MPKITVSIKRKFASKLVLQPQLIILDRDGVINHDSDNYIKSPQEWIPIQGSLEAISQLNKAAYHIAIASNQSGIGRGYYDLATLEAMHQKMQDLLTPLGGHIDHIEFCPHLPDDNCNCRKPKAGMLDKISKKFAIDPQDIVMVGDTMGDYQAAINAHMSFVLVKTGKGERTLTTGQLSRYIPIYANLAAYVNSLNLDKE
jgi:D-glycero-D-manno-heptose 1,7-bisphosphate phosphatase